MILHLCIHLVVLGLILRVNLVSFRVVLDSEYLLPSMYCLSVLSKLMANSSLTSTPGAFFTYEFQVSSSLFQSDANGADLLSLLETVRVSYPDPSFLYAKWLWLIIRRRCFIVWSRGPSLCSLFHPIKRGFVELFSPEKHECVANPSLSCGWSWSRSGSLSSEGFREMYWWSTPG